MFYKAKVYIMSLKLQRKKVKTNKIKRANDFILISGIIMAYYYYE